MGFVLYITAIILALILYPFGMVYSFFRLMMGMKLKGWLRHLDKLYKITAISIDQTGNAALQHLFNDTLIKRWYVDKGGYSLKNKHLFGDEDETISSVIGKNKKQGSLTRAGKALDYILESLDPGHSIKAIE